MKRTNRVFQYFTKICVLLCLLFWNAVAIAQIKQAEELLGKEYNPVYDKGKYIENYEHNISTINGIVVRVTILFNLSKTKTVDLANLTVNRYKALSDSVFYDAKITPDFSYNDLVFDEKGESVMHVYDSIYYYIFVCNKKTNEIKLIHQLNTPKIKLVAIKETISTFKMTKGIFGKYEMSKKELDSLNIALVFYKNKHGNDGFANYQRNSESFSAGDMTELKVMQTKKTDKSPEKTTYTFVWDYFNSYDNDTGKADVVLITSCENALRTTFVCKVYVRSKKEYLYFEGYLE
jgi:hypothetical protein